MVTTVADGLALGAAAPDNWPPTWLFNGLAVGERGDIYVTGDIGNVVYRITERPRGTVRSESAPYDTD